MNKRFKKLTEPPFPEMRWGKYGSWEGEVALPAWTEFATSGDASLSVMIRDPDDCRIPSSAQKKALTFQMDHGDLVVASVLTALLPYYNDRRPRYLDFLGDEADELMPTVQSIDELRSLIDLRHVHVHHEARDGLSYIGLQYGCTWDVEHGLGFLLHRDRIVEIGSADISFASTPKEADPEP